MISEHLFPLLEQCFPDLGMTMQTEPCPTAVFPPVHPDIGPVTVSDECDEITIEIGGFTHNHYNRFGFDLSERERVLAITEDVLDFLQQLFNDRVLLYRNTREVYGGCRVLGPDEDIPPAGKGVEYFLWSGPCY